MSNKYFVSATWIFAEKAVRMFLGLFIGIWIARYLGVENFGLYSYAQSVVGLFAVFATLGLDSVVVREIVRNPDSRNTILATAFWLRLAGAGVVIILLFTYTFIVGSNSITRTLILLAGLSTIFQAFHVVDMAFQAAVNGRYSTIANVVTLIVSSAIKVIFIFAQAPLIYFVAMLSIDALVLSFCLIYIYEKKYTIFDWCQLKFSTSHARQLAKEAWPLMLTGLIVSSYMKADQLIIQNLLGDGAVGQYAAAVTISQAYYFIPLVLSNVFYPAIINAKRMDNEIYLNRLQNLYSVLVWIAIGAALIICFNAEIIVKLLYGEQFHAAAGVLRIYCWAGVAVFFGSAWSKWMVVEGYQSTVMKINVIAMLANVGLNFWLIPLYGIEGAAIATVISYSAGHSLFALLFSNQKLAIKMLLRSLNPILTFEMAKNYFLNGNIGKKQ